MMNRNTLARMRRRRVRVARAVRLPHSLQLWRLRARHKRLHSHLCIGHFA